MRIENGVPTIDISPFLKGTPAGRDLVVSQVKSACENIGFFSIVGHGVSEGLINSIRQISNEFFARPLEEKNLVKRAADVGSPPGYSSMGDVALAKTLGAAGVADYQESFVIGRPTVPNDPYWQTPIAESFFKPNLWPAHPSHMRDVYERYFQSAGQLAENIMRIFALALDLDENHFQSKVDKAYSVLRVTSYPAQTVPPVEGQLRSGEHTDYGMLTILLAEDKPGGLQVRTLDGKWIDVHPVPGSFILNIGDLMMRWTNDHWISTLHRVANPPREFAHLARLSVVFFLMGNYDAEVRCIQKYAGAATKPKYPPTTIGEHFLSKQAKARAPKVAVGN